MLCFPSITYILAAYFIFSYSCLFLQFLGLKVSKATTNRVPELPITMSAKQTKAEEPPNYHFDQTSTVSFQEGSHFTKFKCRIERTPRPQYRNFATTKSSNSKKVRLWNVSKPHQLQFASAFQEAADKAGARFQLGTGMCVFVVARFYFPRPKKHFVYDHRLKTLVLPNSPPKFVTNIPNVDNCAKLVLDSLQSVAYSNDCHVVQFNCTKVYDDTHRVWPKDAEHTKSKGCTLISVTVVDQSKLSLASNDCSCAHCSF